MRLKKIISVLIAALFILGAAPAAFAAGETVTQDNITYMLLDDGTYAVKDAMNCQRNVVIPSEISGIPVSRIMSGAFVNNAGTQYAMVESITIPASVKIVNAYAFRGCAYLKSVTFEESISNVTIQNEAFSGCSDLASVTLPTIISSIPDKCFYECGKLSEILIPETVKTIGKEAFLYCSSISSIIIPASVNSINEGAFFHCSRVNSFSVSGGTSYKAVAGVLYSYDGKTLVQFPLASSVVNYSIPNGVTKIDYGAFAFSKVASVQLPENLTEIADKAFEYSTSLSVINFPLGLETIGHSAFLNCDSLKDITLPASLTLFEDAFKHSAVEKVTLACGITEIPSRAFADCNKLNNVFVPASVESILPGAFANCINITINAPKDSYAIQFAVDNGIDYAICSDDIFHLDLNGNGCCDGCEDNTETNTETNPTQTKPTETITTEKPTKPTTTENPLAKVKITAPSGTKQIKWKYRPHLVATAKNLPKGYGVAWFEGESKVSDNGDFTAEKGLTSTHTYTAKIVDEKGKAVASSQEKTVKIDVKDDFITKIISFFTRLFGSDLVELK